VQVRLRYAGRDRPESERIVHPLGLVKKASVWYLVAGTDAGLRTFRLSRVRAVTVTDQPVDRPEGFDLAETWRSVVDTVDERRAGFRVTARADAEMVRWLRGAFGSRARVRGETDDGRTEVELRSWSARSIAGELAAFGARVEVVDPPEVRDQLLHLGSELVERYGSGAVAR
jgi:predicted DNA-binding transcriptional regulator YafY